MKRQPSRKQTPWRILLGSVLLVASGAHAHNDYPEAPATIYATDPQNPEISYDSSPYVYSPDVPENPTVVYQSGSAPTPPTPPGPNVVTDNTPADSYTLNRSPWHKYHAYDVPNENDTIKNGPYFSSGVPMKFDFGTASSPVEPGYTRVTESTLYSTSTGYGWNAPNASRDRGSPDNLRRDSCLPGPGAAFYVDIPNGRYRITITFGDAVNKVTKLYSRIDGIPVIFGATTQPGQWSTQTFLFEVGRDALSPTRLWRDDQSPLPLQTSGRLRFEFSANGSYITHICSIKIEPVLASDPENTKPIIYIASDSTVASYGANPSGGPYPSNLNFMGWGEPLYNYFDNNVIIDNLAQPGRSSRSYVEEGILDTVLNRIKPGDYLFVMFAINDSADVLPPAYNNRDTKPFTTHEAWTRLYINEARKRGAIPVLVTSQIKCTYDSFGRFYNSVQDYPQADRELGAELGVPVVDLNKESVDYLTALGPLPDDGDPTTERLPAATQWYRTNPDGTVNDYIHPSPYGGNQYAKRVSRLILKTPGLEELASHVIAPPLPQPAIPVRSSY